MINKNSSGRKILVRILIVNFIFLTIFTSKSAAAKEPPLFAGGMFFTMAPQYVGPLEKTTVPMGVGGRFYFYLGNFMRLGGMGSVLKRNVGNLAHSMQLGGGGLFAHYCHRWSFFELAGGVFIGGQSLKIERVEDYENDLYRIRRFKNNHWLLTPQLDFTFFVSEKFQLLLMAEYRHPYFTNNLLGHTVQLYFGIHFTH